MLTSISVSFALDKHFVNPASFFLFRTSSSSAHIWPRDDNSGMLPGRGAITSLAMHPVLLVDEIVQTIFDSLESVNPSLKVEDLQRTYALLARCCKAWKDLALDRLWNTVDGMEPILTVLRACEDLKMASACSLNVDVTFLTKLTSAGSCGDGVQNAGVLRPC